MAGTARLYHREGSGVTPCCPVPRHSLVELIAARNALQHQSNLAGLITSGAALIAAFAPEAPVLASARDPLSAGAEVESRCAAVLLTYHGWVNARMAVDVHAAATSTRACVHGRGLPLIVIYGGKERFVDPVGLWRRRDRAKSTGETSVTGRVRARRCSTRRPTGRSSPGCWIGSPPIGPRRQTPLARSAPR